MRLIAPLLFCMIGAAAGAVVALLFRGHGTSLRTGALIGLVGGFAGLWLRDALDLELGGPLPGSLLAVLAGGAASAFAASLALAVTTGGRRGRHRR